MSRRRTLLSFALLCLAASCSPSDTQVLPWDDPRPGSQPAQESPPAAPVSIEVPEVGLGRGADDGAWSYTQLPALAGADHAVEVRLRVEAGAALDLPVHQMDRVVDNDNDESLGGYEAGLVLRRSTGGEMYRFMISTRWQEALLWSTHGGVLQVRPFPFRVGETYLLRAVAAGQRLQLFVGEQLLLEVWDQVQPLREGGAALARKEGATWFGPIRLRQVAPPATAPPPHKPRFALRTWKGLTWGFDGDEPIFALGVPPEVAEAFIPHSFSATAFNVKLMPGYGPKLFIQWFMQNYTSEPFALSVLRQLTVQEQGDRLALQLVTDDEAGRPGLSGRTTVTLTYDPAARAYRYDHLSELMIESGTTLRADTAIDVTDPGIYNGIRAASPGLTWRAPYHHSVFQHESGALYKLPHNHVGWYPGWGTYGYYAARMNHMKPDGGSWILVGDPIANPMLTWMESPSRKEFKADACTFSYDLHFNWIPGGESGHTLGAGTYAVRWRLGAATGAQADLALLQATYAMPGDLGASWLLYTGGVGHVERFDKVVPRASHFSEYPWGGGALQDRTVGRGDSTSLRLDGPMFADSEIGGNRFTEPLLPDTDYQISAWVKTQDVIGEGPGLVFGEQTYYPGITGTSGWRRIGFVARVGAEAPDVLPIALHNSGAGRVWFDDFTITPLTTDAAPDGLDAPPRTAAQANGRARPDAQLLWTGASEVLDGMGTVLDLSGHGRHGVLLGGAAWTSEPQGRVLSFDGREARVLLRSHPAMDLGAETTLSLWVRPEETPPSWRTLVSVGQREGQDRARVVILDGGTEHLWIWVQSSAGDLISATGVLPRDAWSHVVITQTGATGRVYVNGAPVLEGPLPARWLGQGVAASLRLGACYTADSVIDAFLGKMTNVRLVQRALSTAEVSMLTAEGAFPR